MQNIIASIQRIPIRLTDERWAHITEEHCELAGLKTRRFWRLWQNRSGFWPVEKVRFWQYENYFLGKHLVAVYLRELADDGFIITASP